jgi:signal transduction histidine kinase
MELDMSASGRFAERIEVTAYYVVSELLPNAVKHARASIARMAVDRTNGMLHVSVLDDGVGGADPARGSGLTGLRDRVEAIGGTIAIESAAGAGTAVLVSLPLD